MYCLTAALCNQAKMRFVAVFVILCTVLTNIHNYNCVSVKNQIKDRIISNESYEAPVDNKSLEKSERDINGETVNIETNSAESMDTAADMVYRPLFVYRRIQHSKRRITMYNSFAG